MNETFVQRNVQTEVNFLRNICTIGTWCVSRKSKCCVWFCRGRAKSYFISPFNQWSVDENKDIGIILKATSFAFHRVRELRKEKKKYSFISHEISPRGERRLNLSGVQTWNSRRIKLQTLCFHKMHSSLRPFVYVCLTDDKISAISSFTFPGHCFVTQQTQAWPNK